MILAILTTTLFLGSVATMQNPETLKDVQVRSESNTVSYIPHSQIIIDDDTDFISQGWPGYGNETHPYLIENLEIQNDDFCISITGTSVNFAIINCNLTRDGNFFGNFGVYFTSLVNASVINCTIYRMYYGIYCEDVQNAVFRNNTLSRSMYGLNVRDSENIFMVNNTATIGTSRSSECYIDQNYGGVLLRRSYNFNITNSDFGTSSLSFDADTVEQYIHNIADNTIQGLPVVYMKNTIDQIVNPTGYGQLILANCSEVQILNGIAPIVHLNLEWITIGFSNHCSIIGNVIPECNYGVIMHNSPHTYIGGNVIEYARQTGMHIVDSQNCSIIENEFHNCMGALYYYSSNANISYNIVDSCQSGLMGGSNCTVIGNTLWNCTNDGIEISGDYSVVKDNIISTTTLSPYSTGLDCGGSYNHLENNSITGFRVSIQLDGANCTLIDNTLVGKGISMVGDTLWHWMHTMSGNALNGQPLHYIRNQSGGVIDAANISQLIVVNCTGLEIRDGILDEILAVGFCDQILLENNTVSNAVVGFWLLNITNSQVKDNRAIANQAAGFILRDFENCSIEGNTATLHDDDGVGFGLQYGTNCTFTSNVATHNQMGMELHNVINFTLESNVFSHNEIYGIYVPSCAEGIVVDNEISFNDFVGIFVQQSAEIILHSNEIGYNTFGNAREDGTQNQWDDGVDTGNAWSDYSGSGTYLISGSASSEDRYPCLLNYGPEIDPLSDIEYEDGSTAPLLNWTVSGQNLDSFVIYKDGIFLESGDVNGSIIAVEVGELDLGIHNITLYVNDTVGLYSVDTVVLTVVDTTAPTIVGPGDNISWTSDIGSNYLSWNAYDLNPVTYSIFINGSLFATGLWNSSGETITANMDHLGIGHHNVTLVVSDSAGNTAVDTVMVTAELGTTTGTTTEFPMTLVIAAVLGSVAVVIVVVILLRSKKS